MPLVLRNPKHEAFCQHWVFGNPKRPLGGGSSEPDTRQNAFQCYIAVGYRARGAAARACASRLLAQANIQERISELRREEQRLREVYLRPWKALVPAAQQVLVDAVEGKEVTSQQLQAAREILHQALGPVQHRFRHPEGDKGVPAIRVTLWSGASGAKDDDAGLDMS